MVSVTLGKLMILDTHTNRYLGDCAPDITAISIGYGVSDFNAVLVIELQVRILGGQEPSTTHESG